MVIRMSDDVPIGGSRRQRQEPTMKVNSLPMPLPLPMPAQRAPLRGEAAAGYLTSSFDLRAGLEVSAVALSQLPAEVMRELLRLRDSWETPAQALRA
jgi:hypothetical protein